MRGAGEQMRLTHAGTELSAETLRNPPVVICNYVFDTLTQDAFRVKDGTIGQGMVTVKSAEPDADTREDGSFTHDLIRHMRCEWTFEDVDLSKRAEARAGPAPPCPALMPVSLPTPPPSALRRRGLRRDPAVVR